MSDWVKLLREAETLAYEGKADELIAYRHVFENGADEIERLRGALVNIREWALSYKLADGSFEEDKAIPHGFAKAALEKGDE